MAALADSMPPLLIPQPLLAEWGAKWSSDVNPDTGRRKPKGGERFDKQQSMNFPLVFDQTFGNALAAMLGGIPVVEPNANALVSPQPDCVEVGSTRIIGGIRPQNFDAAYRPDGPRVVFDSKTLNDLESVKKNWQNMVNDLATEAATVHTRFPYCIVAFLVAIPRPALGPAQETTLIRTLERMSTRKDVLDQAHLAEAMAFVVWDPATGEIDPHTPAPTSILRIEQFSDTLFPHYLDRYKGLPPHS